jgi:glycosyltransferase involved in cell wall biosynthesis
VGLLYANAFFKGLDLSVSALKRIRDQFPDLRIVCFGTEHPQLELPKGTQFFFAPPQNKIRDLYAQCDVWLTASRSEGFNLPAMEAMACRTPVVSTNTGWPEEAVKSGWNGVLVDIEDIDGLAQGLTWVLSQPNAVWKQLSANAYATVAESTWAASAKLFEKALERARRTARSD